MPEKAGWGGGQLRAGNYMLFRRGIGWYNRLGKREETDGSMNPGGFLHMKKLRWAAAFAMLPAARGEGRIPR